MSDTSEKVGSDPPEISEQSAPKASKSRIMSETQLAQLALAREKAVMKRRELGDLKRREKAVKDDLLSKRIAKLKLVEKSESSESYESSEEPEPEPKPRAVRKKHTVIPLSPPPSKPRRPRADPQDYTTQQLTAEMARHELQQRVQRETYSAAFASMFPGHVLKF